MLHESIGRRSVSDATRASRVVFVDPKSRALLRRIEQLAPSRATVLLHGETGTGKEVAARQVHQLSARCERPFVAVNCGALTESLVESQLFGHERGAFTGATSSKAGCFETAHGGTLFLDEIGELSLAAQVKLLRVLQEREVVRVGSQEPFPVDVRLIAATNVALEEAVAAGRFRADLYYRMNVAAIHIPALRERRQDIIPLAEYFLKMYGEQLAARPLMLDRAAERSLVQYSWPGNIRELENVIHHATLVCNGELVTAADLQLSGTLSTYPPPAHDDGDTQLEQALQTLFERGHPSLYRYLEQRIVIVAHEYSGKNQMQTSRLLGLSRNVVRARLIECGAIAGAQRSRSEPPVRSEEDE
jgi:sigma-54 dependent transcriptional regulator